MKSQMQSAGQTRYDALLQLLGTADSIWNASRIFFAAWDLSPSQFNVLSLLHGNPAGLSQTELSRRLIMHRSNITGLADRLEERKLVQRKDVAGDRRAYRVVLTRAGTALLEEILPEYHARADALWDDLPLSRVSILAEDLQALARNAQRIAAELPSKPTMALPP
jgi:DNA-binding MarR family transcriptional regulator